MVSRIAVKTKANTVIATKVSVAPAVDNGPPVKNFPKNNMTNAAKTAGVKRYCRAKEGFSKRSRVMGANLSVPILNKIFPTPLMKEISKIISHVVNLSKVFHHCDR